jgi:hypothetical protein
MRVRAKVLCFVDNGLRKPGDEFNYEGPASRNLEPLTGSWPGVVVEPSLAATPPRKRGGRRKVETAEPDPGALLE